MDANWYRPERRDQAGKIAIIGGNSHEFSRTQAAFSAALTMGFGEVRVILPKKLQKHIPPLEGVCFAAATATGSFAHEALPELSEHIRWADCIYFPGELSKNAETTVLFNTLLSQSSKPTALSHDSIDLVTDTSTESVHLVATVGQLQKLGTKHRATSAATFSMSPTQLAEWMHAQAWLGDCTTYIHGKLVAKLDDKVVSEPHTGGVADDVWRMNYAVNYLAWQLWTGDKLVAYELSRRSGVDI